MNKELQLPTATQEGGMEITVAKLEGAELDYWVARALGWKHLGAIGAFKSGQGKPWCLSEQNDWWERPEGGNPMCGPCNSFPYAFSTQWEHGGPIIEQAQMTFSSPPSPVHRNYGYGDKRNGYEPLGCWSACTWSQPRAIGSGSTMLIAAMRCFVASKFGQKFTSKPSDSTNNEGTEQVNKP